MAADRPNVLMVGMGEYTTGYVHDRASGSDKGAGVVALTVFDLRRRRWIGDVLMAGTQGSKFPGIRRHLQSVIADRYAGLDVSFRGFPDDDVQRDPSAYRRALEHLQPGDGVCVFTPDDTHFEIAAAAIDRGCHVLIAKPLVQRLSDHRELVGRAEANGVLVAMEVHKRWDPIYADARDRIRSLGAFSYFHAYMSQPRSQLDTFRAWAGTRSDISYYLNAHHVDFLWWALDGRARPVSIQAVASTGVACSRGIDAEDVITLATQWRNESDGALATAVFTSAWIAPKSDVHSQQRFHYLGHDGELQVDQAHRGYSTATHAQGYQSPNPLFMKYAPDAKGRFAGQAAYGYRSIETFVNAVRSIRRGETTARDWNGELATAASTAWVTAVLEAGRRSLDAPGKVVPLKADSDGQPAFSD